MNNIQEVEQIFESKLIEQGMKKPFLKMKLNHMYVLKYIHITVGSVDSLVPAKLTIEVGGGAHILSTYVSPSYVVSFEDIGLVCVESSKSEIVVSCKYPTAINAMVISRKLAHNEIPQRIYMV